MKTFVERKETVVRSWYHIDAEGMILGRLAVEIARRLMGKHKPTYTPHVDTGDFVVVTNAGRVKVTGNKTQTMLYPRYSYYAGGYKEVPFERERERHPDRIIREAVRRMLPKTALGKQMLRKLKVYGTETHPHAAQQPEQFTF